MKKYESYKESGIDWVGNLPKDWVASKLKYYTDVITGNTPSMKFENYYSSTTGIPWVKPNDLNEFTPITKSKQFLTKEGSCQARIVRKGSILVGGIGDIGKLGVAGTDITTNQQIHSVEGNLNKIDDDFLKYLIFNSIDALQKASSSVVLSILTKTKLLDLAIVVPSQKEQNQIANYLDHKTTIIDALILKKEQLIKKLQAQRQAIINEAVTKGLNKNAKMKNSGIEWLGEIPEHWVVKRISSISELLTGFPWKSNQFNFEKGTKILRGENVSEGFLRWGTRTRFWPLEIDKESVHWLKSQDIIIPMDGSKVGKNYVLVKEEDLPIILHQRMCRLRFGNDIIANFIEFYISSNMFQYHVNSTKTDPMIPHITQKNIADFKFALPPGKEIIEITNYCNNINNSLKLTIEKTEDSLLKLKLYRQSLISEAITGKIDVRDWQARNK